MKETQGYFESNDGQVSGLGEQGASFVQSYEEGQREREEKTADWVIKLRSLGIKAAHPDDGWHDRENKHFGLCYPYFDEGLQVGDMVALGDYEKFVVVVISHTSGMLSKRYHYKATIH